MGSDKGGAKAPAGGSGSDPRTRAMLDAVTRATHRLTVALDDVGLNQQLRESATCRLRSLDRGLPDETLGDLLLNCEAFATVTGPATLTTGDVARIRAEAQRVLHRVQTLASAVRGARRLTLTGSSTQMQNTFMRSALIDSQVQQALAQLIEALTALASLEEAGDQQRKRLLVVGPGCVVPTAVLGGALALIVFLLTSIAVATGQDANLASALKFPSLSLQSVATTTATTTAKATAGSGSAGNRSSATPIPGKSSTPTVKPKPTAGATQGTGSGALAVSPNSVPACQGQNVSFTITYTGGSAPVSWQTSGYNTNDIQLSPSGGTLSPGQSVTVGVTVNADSVGSITITPSNGSPAATVGYDSSGC